MKATPNPNVGDVIKVTINQEKIALLVCKKGPMSMPEFNHWIVKYGNKMLKVSWNPMIESFFAPDYTD